MLPRFPHPFNNITDSLARNCLQVDNANYAATYCKCNHLTSFGSGFFVVPNTIDFAYVFANAGFADNVTIYMCVILTMLIYLLLLIWARREDLKDNEKVSLGASLGGRLRNTAASDGHN